MAGSRYERHLTTALNEVGRPAIRAPSSGSRTDRDLPDILAGSRVELSGVTGPINTYSTAWAIELKTTSGTTAYAEDSEVGALATFAYRFGATPFLATKFKREGGSRSPFWLVKPEDCRVTDAGTYGVPESDVEKRASWAVFPETQNADAEVREVRADA